MHAASPQEFSRLAAPSTDLRPDYDLATASRLKSLWRHRGWILAATFGAALLALGCATLMGKTYTSEALIQLTFTGGASQAALPSGAAGVTTDALAMVENEVAIIQSDGIARRVLQSVGESAPPSISQRLAGVWNARFPDWAVPPESSAIALDRRLLALSRALTVSTDGKTYLIRVGYAAADPERAAAVANAYAEAYLSRRAMASAEAAHDRSIWLAAQVDQADKDRDEAQGKAIAYRQRMDVIAAGGGTSMLREQEMRDLVTQISAAHLSRLQVEAKLQRLTTALSEDRTPSATDLSDSADAQRLIDAEVSASSELSRVSGSLGAEHPLYGRAQANLGRAKQQLTETVEAATQNTRVALDSARSAEESLATQLAALKTAMTGSQLLDRTLAGLEADVTTAQTNLNRLRDDHREAEAMADLKPAAATLIGRAEPISIPTAPKLPLVVMLGALAGALASVGIIMLGERRDGGFVTTEAVTQELGIPCVGMVLAPLRHLRRGDAHVRDQALKSLAIKTELADAKNGCVVVVVTSALPGEGKTRLVHGLASALAELGRRVLIVERTGAFSASGLAAGKNRAALQRIYEAPREQIAASSSASYHQTRGVLASRDQLEVRNEEADNRFDVVIVEAPAVLADPEALLIARAADLVLFAVRWHATSRACVATAFKRLLPGHGQQAMAVLTEVSLQQHRKLGSRDELHFHRAFASKYIKA